CDLPGGRRCPASQSCDPLDGVCRASCTPGAGDCPEGRRCDPDRLLCVRPCGSDEECAGGHCNEDSGLCEAPRDIADCAPPAQRREYVDADTNACVPTAGRLDDCAAHGGRDEARPEVPEG